MSSRAMPMRTPLSGLLGTAESGTRKLAYVSLGTIPFGIAVKMSSDSYPFSASSTSVASLTVLQWMPERSPAFLLTIPPSMRMPLVVTRLTTLFLEAGPLQDAAPCSQIEHVTRLAATETPDPLLDPRGTRAVSYGLHGWPPHGEYARSFSGTTESDFAGPGGGGSLKLFAVMLLAEATA